MAQQYFRFVSFRKRILFLTISSVGIFFLLIYFSNVGLMHNGADSATLQKDVQRSNKVQASELPHTLVGSYYRLDDRTDAKLLLNNKGITQLEIQPTLYSLQGQELQLPLVTVEPRSHRFIDLHEWVATGGEGFRSGSIRLFHYGKDLVLGAQIYLTDEFRSLSFEEKLSELSKFDSRLQEADSDKETQKLIEILRKREEPAEVIFGAIKTLGDKKAKEAISELIKYLDYEKAYIYKQPKYAGGVKVDGTEIGRTIPLSGRYPATAALFQIGKSSLPALLRIIEENNPESVKSKNALYTIQFIFRDDLLEAIKYFEKAKKDSATQEEKQRLSNAIEKTRKECLRIQNLKVN